MPETLNTELGVLSTLSGVDERRLELLGEELLPDDRRTRFIGHATTRLEERRQLEDIRALGIQETVQCAAIATAAPDTRCFQILGFDIVRGQPGGTRYERPRAEDAPRNEIAEAFLADIVHAHVPLLDEVQLIAQNGSRQFVHSRELLVARLGVQYAVSLVPDAINLEVVLSRSEKNPAQAWETYCQIQPSPILD